ncbi:hypothetical protein BTH42_32515 [Burkholderia sp. SRS-W-2-2016]|nr:hypothetical protein BTH42_32515 [Burkholderia sp. SRS-W-2-2016]
MWVSAVFNLRTVTTPDLLGEPALEGVHSDGVEHTMTTLLGHANMSPDSAETYSCGFVGISGSAAVPRTLWQWQMCKCNHIGSSRVPLFLSGWSL